MNSSKIEKNMVIRDLATLKQFFQQTKPPVFGIGVYAFNRLGLEKIIPNYRIIALRHSLDTKLIEKDIKVLSLEKGMGTKHIREPRNATTVIQHSKTKKYIEKFSPKNSQPCLLVYKPSKKMEKICKENNWKLIANPSHFGKELFENKIKFRKILKQLGLAVPLGRINSIMGLDYGKLADKYDLPFVIQHPTKGGGKGTFFIKNQDDFNLAFKKLNKKRDEEDEKTIIPPDQVIISQFIQGPSPSITACVTRQGILSTNLQHQVLDIPQLYNPKKGSGLFCGHDWTAARFAESVCNQAYQAVEKVGQYFKKMGYQGIFGLDFILDKKTQKLYIIECNPRMIGSFPPLNMAQLLNNEPPILAFHVLEFLGIDYQIDINEINRLMRQDKIGSQIILHNLTGRWAKNHHQLKAGIYRLKTRSRKLKYLRPGYDLKDLKHKKEFLLADGVSLKKSHFSPNRRLCRILTLSPVLAHNADYQQLTPWAKQVTKKVYQGFDIRPVKWVKIKKFFAPHFLAKG